MIHLLFVGQSFFETVFEGIDEISELEATPGNL